MARLLKDNLPQPTPQYNPGQFNQLVQKLQLILSQRVHTEDEADEDEAINFFLSN